MKKVLLGSMVLAILVTTANAESNTYDNGVYVGIDAGFLNFGGDSLNVDTTKSGVTSTKSYGDIDSTPIELKVGYQHYRGNRVELYAKYNDIGTNGGDIEVDTYGVNYEFGFSSLSSRGKLLPYLVLGAGVGEAKSSKLKQLDNTDVVEFNLGFGFHYQFTQDFYSTFGYTHQLIVFDNIEESHDATYEVSDANTNMFKLGVGYHF